jgi:hypothetical protein
MASKLNKKSRIIFGPWSHTWPDISAPGPTIDFLGICLKWFDAHLKENSKENSGLGPDPGPRTGENGTDEISSWPRLKLFLREAHAPANYIEEYPGKWMAANDWQSAADEYEKVVGLLSKGSAVSSFELENVKIFTATVTSRIWGRHT